jgi:PAS domain S-box-containing protein
MSRFAKRRALLAWGAAALAGAAVSLVVELGSHHMRPSGVELAINLFVGLSFAATGVIAWARRPENNTGRLLLVVSFAWSLALLGSANDGFVSALGVASGALVLAAFVHLVLAYPAGLLPTKVDHVIVMSGYALAIGANLLTLMFDPHAACPKCTTSVLLVADKPAVAHAVETTTNVVAALLIATVVGILVVRYRAATPVARRALRPIGLTGATALTFLAAGFAAGPIDQGVKDVLVTIALLALATVPFWFLAGLLRSRLARGGVAQLLLDVRETASLEEARDGLRRALNDPGVMLAAWVEERHGYVDPDGRAFDVPSDDVSRVATLVASESGDHLAVIVHDRALLDEPELLDAVAVAARLALHRNRLQAELRARLDELQRERDFMRDVVNAAPAFFCVVDLEGHIIRFNDRMAQATGVLDDESTRGRFVWEVFAAPEDVAEFRECVTANASGEHQHLFRDPDGGTIDVAWSLTPIPDSQGVLRLVLTGADVSDRVRHAEELRRSRSRLVDAADAERRRLERNLHDGAQQRLVSLSLALRLAESKLRVDPETASTILSGAGEELALALQELRELARGLHPAILSDRGLAPALETLAERASVPVEVDVDLDHRLPGPVEVAIFYVVSESLANVAKHAAASAATVRVARDGDAVVVVVADNGLGGADDALGSGLRGLSDRIEALDGRLVVESPAGAGTRVSATMPLAQVRQPVPSDAG